MDPITEYLAHVQSTLSASKYKGAKYALKRLPGLTQADLMAWYGNLCDRTGKHTTKNTEMAHVMAFVKWAHDRDALPDLSLRPFKRFKRRDDEIRPAPTVLTREEIRRLVLACPGNECGSIALAALLTGARKMELHNFKPRQVAKDGVITIMGQKGRAERLIDPKYLGSGLTLFTRAAKASRDPFKYVRYHWVELQNAAILPGLCFKTLRATVSSYMKSAGIAPWVVDSTLGHTADVAAKHYDRLVPGVSGATLPEIYGCADDFAQACESVHWPLPRPTDDE